MNGQSLLAELERVRRRHELATRCRMLLGGLDNSDDDPELVFAGLPFELVQAAANADPAVHVAYKRLRPDQLARLFGFEGDRTARTRQQIEIIKTPRRRLGGVEL